MHPLSFESTADDGAYFWLTTSGTSERLFELMRKSLRIERHCDLYQWLQGDLQELLPHQILIAAWGDFEIGTLKYDVISALPGVCTVDLGGCGVNPAANGLFLEWLKRDCLPFAIDTPIGLLVESIRTHSSEADMLRALHNAGTSLVHGIRDRRGRQDRIYVALSIGRSIPQCEREIFELLLPFIDAALRRSAFEPAQLVADAIKVVDAADEAAPDSLPDPLPESGLSSRELEIMDWVSKGKTNPEIGVILDISAFTVKNHLQRIFRKLDVSNRAQAVALFERIFQRLPQP